MLNGYEILRGMLYDDNRLLLFLPLAHCFARYIQYVCIGGSAWSDTFPTPSDCSPISAASSPPTCWACHVCSRRCITRPRRKAGAGIQGHIYAQSVKHFVKWSKDEQAGRGHSFIERMRHSFYMATVGKSIRSALGPNLKWLACGGAPLNVDWPTFSTA